MKRNKITKVKRRKHEDDEEEENEEEEDNNYVEDDFLVNDNEEKEDRFRPMNPEADLRAQEADIESELNSSDLEVMEDKPERKSKKLKRGIRKRVEEEEFVERRREMHSRDEDMSNFIEPDYPASPKVKPYSRKHQPKSTAHHIFTLDENDQMTGESSKVNDSKVTVYDKEELEEEFATHKDEVVKVLDYPERLLRHFTEDQLLALARDVDLEADWILEKMKTIVTNVDSIPSMRKKITLVLDLHKREFIDIPHIATYKKMFIEPELTVKDIWRIFEMDREWTRLMDYKASVRKGYDSIVRFLDSTKSEMMERRYIENAKNITELKDMEAFIAFMKEIHKGDIKDEDDNLVRRPNKRSLIDQLKDSKIRDYVSRFALTAHELAINLDLNSSTDPYNRSRMVMPPNPNDEPAALAFQFISPTLSQEIQVMTTACKYLALEMFSHPYIRGYARSYFKLNVALTTEPTEEGQRELDVFNPSYRCKRIKRKPVESFNSDLFLDIPQCENKGLITLKIDYESDLKELLDRIYSCFNPGDKEDSGNIASKWRIMREEAVRVLVVEYLLPEFLKEIRQELTERAENYVIAECAHHFQNLLMTGPYRKQRSSDSNDIFADEESPKVMSFVLDASKNVVHCAILDAHGELLDFSHYTQLTIKAGKSNNPQEKELYYMERDKLKDNFSLYKPDLIIIGANDLKCKYIKEQISSIIDPDNKNSDGYARSAWVTYGDLTIPKVFANSQIAEKKLKAHNMFLRQAISLGRLKQNPLAEILQLWSEDVSKNACLSIPMHPLQKFINQSRLNEMLEMRAIEVVNNVGVELNEVFEHHHLRAMLSFVSGLGPRKAALILHNMINFGGHVYMRMQLAASHILGKRVFMNCAGFLKIKSNPSQEVSKFDLLDMTRIHPEAYPMAKKLATSASDDPENERAVELCLRNPKNFNSLDLKEFIKRSEEKGTYNMKATVNFITYEFNNPFKDPRGPHKDLTPSELFYMLIGDDNFKMGNIVLARVIKVDGQHVKCRLNNDLEATVWIKDIYEDDHIDRNKEEDMKEKFKEQTSFEARVKSINENNFKVDLSIRPSVLASHKNFMQVNLDKFFVVSEEDYINRNYQEESKSEHRKYIPRQIKHPAFKNFTFQQTIDHLRTKDIGDYIFRPSSKGVNNITLTWKFYKMTYAHVDIVEEEKLPGSSIGSKLRISNDVYSSIDEIVDRHLEPCRKSVKGAEKNRKFIHFDTNEELERKLKEDKHREPDILHYLFAILPEYPLYIILAYTPKPNVVTKEFIRVKPRGLFFHDEYFADLERLVVWYKSNYGQDSYREYAKRMRPPMIEERRKPNDPHEFSYFVEQPPMNDSWEKHPQSNFTQGRSNTRTCHVCNLPGHLAKDCPAKRQNETLINSKRERPREGEDWPNQVESNNWNVTANWCNQNDSKENAGWGNNNGGSTGWGNSSTNETNPPRQESNSWEASNYSTNNSGSANNYSSNNYERKEDNRDNQDRGERGNRDHTRGRGRGGSFNNRDDRQDTNRSGNGNFQAPSNNWESKTTLNTQSDVNSSSQMQVENENPGWGNEPTPQTNTSSWGPTASANPSTTENVKAPETSGWGNNDSSNVVASATVDNSSGWGNQSSTSGWGNDDKTAQTNTWGSSNNQSSSYQSSYNQGGSDSNTFSNTNNYFNKRENSDNRRSDDRGGDRKKGCYNCGEEGHMGRDCPQPKKDSRGGGGRACFNCGEEGHNKQDCTKPRKDTRGGGGRACFNCGEEGHNKQDCTNPRKDTRGGGGGRACFNCGEEGHNKQDCTNPRKDTRGGGGGRACFNCGEEGHNKQDCTNPRKDTRACFNCGETGHINTDCTQPKKDSRGGGGRACFNCGEEGHNKQDCTNPRKDTRGGGGGRACFNCGEEGHNKQDCTKPRKDTRSCFNCGESGHINTDCTQPKKDTRGGDRKKGCFNCNEEGHMSKDCPKPRTNKGPRRDFRSPRSDDNFNSPQSPSGWNNNSNDAGGNNSSSKNDNQTGWANSSSNNDGGWTSSTNNAEGTAWGATSSTNNNAGGSAWGTAANNPVQDQSSAWGTTANNNTQDQSSAWGTTSNNPVQDQSSAWGTSGGATNLDNNIQGYGQQTAWGTSNTEQNKWGSAENNWG